MTQKDSTRRELSRALTIIARQMRGLFDQKMAVIGVTRSKWTLIAVAAAKPGSTQRTIAETLEVSEAAAGRLIDKLCTDGLLERRPRDDDRRAYSIFLTDRAQPFVEQLSTLAGQMEDIAFAGMGDDEIEQLGILLGRVYANLNGERERPAVPEVSAVFAE